MSTPIKDEQQTLNNKREEQPIEEEPQTSATIENNKPEDPKPETIKTSEIPLEQENELTADNHLGENGENSPKKQQNGKKKSKTLESETVDIIGERSGFGDEDFQDSLSHQAKKSRISKKSKRSKRSKKPAEYKLFLGGLPGDTTKGNFGK